jgi:hypothetical protein
MTGALMQPPKGEKSQASKGQNRAPRDNFFLWITLWETFFFSKNEVGRLSRIFHENIF